MQKPQVPRETFIALRARREAYQIATDILYEEPIDVRTVACRGCGDLMDVKGPIITDPLTCKVCRERTPLPKYIRARFLSRTAQGIDEDSPLMYEHLQRSVATVQDEAWYAMEVPRWVWRFSLVLLCLLVLGAIVTSVFALIPY